MKKYGLQNYRSYIKSEVVDGKYWITGNDSEVCDVCLENQKAGVIPLQAIFPSGHLHPPAGELCRCSLGGRTDEDA